MISIIIPTGNSFIKKRGSIRFVLFSLGLQLDSSFEVVIIHNGSNEDFASLNDFIKENSFSFNLVCHKGALLTTAASRNLGVKKSKYENIVFIDDDTLVLDENIISKLISIFKQYDFFLGAERLRIKGNESFRAKQSELLMLNKSELLAKIHSNAFSPSGYERENGGLFLLGRTFIASFGGIKKHIFEKIGGFPEDYLTYEDDVLMYHLFTGGYRGYSLSGTRIYHIEHARTKNESNENHFQEKFVMFLNNNSHPDYCTLKEMEQLETNTVQIENSKINNNQNTELSI